jgi:hypothetical protein
MTVAAMPGKIMNKAGIHVKTKVTKAKAKAKVQHL